MNPYFWLFAFVAVLITPVTGQVKLIWRSGLNLRLTLRVGGILIPLPKAQEAPSDPKKEWAWLTAFWARRRAIWRAAHLQVRDVCIWARIGMADAAATALCFSLLRTVLQTLNGRFLRLCGRVTADFQHQSSEGELSCMIFTRLGNLALAGILLGLEHAKKGKGKEDSYATAASH